MNQLASFNVSHFILAICPGNFSTSQFAYAIALRARIDDNDLKRSGRSSLRSKYFHKAYLCIFCS